MQDSEIVKETKFECILGITSASILRDGYESTLKTQSDLVMD